MPPGLKVNLGCGPVQPAGWVNIDGSNRAWLASRLSALDRLLVKVGLLPATAFGRQVMVHDLCRPLPFPENSVACLYAGEVWEHFEYPDAVRLTAECFRVLSPGGVLRICVPDGPAFWQRYLDLYRAAMDRPRGARDAKQLRDHVALYFHDIATRRIWFGSLGHIHKWQFDEIQLVELLETSGFVEVERKHFRESRVPDVARVEQSDFLIVEGVKPPAARRAERRAARREIQAIIWLLCQSSVLIA